MPMPKAFVTAVMISLASHVLVLSMPVIGEKPYSRPREGGLMTVRLTEPAPVLPEKEEKKEAVSGRERASTKPEGAANPGEREDTVDMGSEDSRYRSYLLKIQKRIEGRWLYPPDALKKKERGTTTARFSIDKDGTLSAQDIVSSSGSAILDEYTLAVIRAAAPYDRLPVDLRLSKLHIVAVFHYRLAE